MLHLSDPTLGELTTFARTLADQSAEVIRHYFHTGYDVEWKEDATPVTVADRKAEEVMREEIMRIYPQHGILGEEHGHHQSDADYQWVLDPIDGTKSFVAGTYLFGTLIALVYQGKPILGVINNPLLNHFLLGVGGGCWLNDRPVRVSSCTQVDESLLVTTSHRTPAEHRDGVAYETLVSQVKRYRTWGDCHGYHLVATGGAEIMTDPILNYWDLMALIPIVEGAGGIITDWYGNDVLLHKGEAGAIATNGHIHDAVVKILNPKD
ncbi:MAG: histidinol-phosphatase [Chloroflexota bacterium]